MGFHYYKYSLKAGVEKVKTRTAVTLSVVGLALSGGTGLTLAAVGTSHADAACLPVTTSKGALTAARVGGTVTGDVDAAGCNIGAYFSTSNPGSVNAANIHDANQYGVFVDGVQAGNTNVDVSNSTITRIGHHTGTDFTPNGSQGGVGVYYAGFNTAGSVTGAITGNDIHDYQKGGVAVNGSKASVEVDSNAITGLPPVSYIAQNGIQLGYGATGEVKHNNVEGNWYTGDNWTSTGILVFESSNVTVEGNTVTGSQTGVDAESWCYYGVANASNNQVVNNEISGADYGAIVAAYSYSSSCSAHADNNKVVNNTITGTDNAGSEGVYVGAYQYDTAFSPVAKNNKVVHNKVTGFDEAYVNEGDAATKVHANSFQ